MEILGLTDKVETVVFSLCDPCQFACHNLQSKARCFIV